MNQEVMQVLQKKVREHANEKFKTLKVKLQLMVDKNRTDVCTKTECFIELKSMISDVHNFIGNLAIQHGIDPHDATREVLKMMLEGNDYAQLVTKSAEAFKDDETVGFC